MGTTRKVLAAAGGTAALALAGACGSGPAPLSQACRAAQAHEFATVASARRLSGLYPDLYPGLFKQEEAALKAMTTAGCPPDTKAAELYGT